MCNTHDVSCKPVVVLATLISEPKVHRLVYRRLVYRRLVYIRLVYRRLVYRRLVYRRLVYRKLVYIFTFCKHNFMFCLGS